MQNTTRTTTAIRRTVGSMLRNSPAPALGTIVTRDGRLVFILEVGAAHYRVADVKGRESLVAFHEVEPGTRGTIADYAARNDRAAQDAAQDAAQAAQDAAGDWDALEDQVEGLGEDDGLSARVEYINAEGVAPEHAADSFTFDPPAPLSGEWAGQLTPTALMHLIGVDPYAVDPEDVSALCDAYESAFFRAFYAAH